MPAADANIRDAKFADHLEELVNPRKLLLAIAVLLMSVPGHAQQIRHPYSIEIKGESLILRNLTDGFLKLSIEISGQNFQTDSECKQTWFLGPGRSTVHKVKAKNPQRKAHFKVFVTAVEYMSMAESRAREAGKPIPEAQPLTPEMERQLASTKCTSN